MVSDCSDYHFNWPGTENMTCEEFCLKHPQPAVCARLQNGRIARPTKRCCECDGCGREPYTLPPMMPSTSLPNLKGMYYDQQIKDPYIFWIAHS